MGLRTVATETEQPVTANQESMPERMLEDVPLPQEPVVVEQAAPPALLQTAAVETLMDLHHNYIPENMIGMTLTRFHAHNGSINDGDKVVFGDFIDFQVFSWHERWFAVSGRHPKPEKNSTANNLCRASFDGGKTFLDKKSGDRCSMAEHVAMMKADGFVEARVELYVDILGIIVGAEKNKNLIMNYGMVQFSVAPTSVGNFTSYAKQNKLMMFRKQIVEGYQNFIRITISTEPSSKGGTYNKTNYSPVPAESLVGVDIAPHN